MRPRTLDEFFGQTHLLAPGKPLRQQIENDDSASLIFWGPPGVGKTTLAKIIANRTSATFIEFSAVLSGIKEIKQVMAEAERPPPTAPAPSSSSTRSTASTRPSRTPSSPTSSAAASASSAPPPRTPASKSSPRCSPAAASTPSAPSTSRRSSPSCSAP
jgi:hypothetical protein